MSMTTAETRMREVASYGGLVDAFGGAATVVLAIVALAGTSSDMLLAIATIVFGAALLIQSGAIVSELSAMIVPEGGSAVAENCGGGGLAIVFLAGTAGIVLGVLALIGIHPVMLASIAVIAFGSAVVFGGGSVWSVFRLKQSGQTVVSGAQIVATEIAAGSAGLQCVGGLAAIVLGILAVTGTLPATLSLVGLLIMGAAIVLTGSTLTGVVQGFMRPGTARMSWSERPAE